MDAFRWRQSLHGLVKQRNGFLTISLGLLVTNIILGISLYTKSERVIIVPAYLKQSFWNEGSLVSDSYIEEMSLFFSKMMLDTTPDSHKYRKDIILRYVAPDHYHELENKLIEDAKRMSKDGVSTTFTPREIKINKLKAEVIGTLTRYVAGTRVGQSKEKYELEFRYSGGIFMLKTFKAKLGEE